MFILKVMRFLFFIYFLEALKRAVNGCDAKVLDKDLFIGWKHLTFCIFEKWNSLIRNCFERYEMEVNKSEKQEKLIRVKW